MTRFQFNRNNSGVKTESMSRRAAILVPAALTLARILPRSACAEDPETGVRLGVTVVQRNGGKIYGREAEWVGSKGQNRSLCGVGIALEDPIPELGITYRFHVGWIGDTRWYTAPELVDFQNANIQGICVELTGASASKFDVCYQAHIGFQADSDVYKNGAFCGTRGLNRDLQALVVVVRRK